MDRDPGKKTPSRKGTITFRPGSRELEVKVVENTDSQVEEIDDSDFVSPPANITASPLRSGAAVPSMEAPNVLANLPGALGPLPFLEGADGKPV